MPCYKNCKTPLSALNLNSEQCVLCMSQCTHSYIESKQITGSRNHSSLHFNTSKADDKDYLMFVYLARWIWPLNKLYFISQSAHLKRGFCSHLDMKEVCVVIWHKSSRRLTCFKWQILVNDILFLVDDIKPASQL